MFNPYAHLFREGLFRTYGKVARVYGFFGVGCDSWNSLESHDAQDIQLVISDPKACNNIAIKDHCHAIFEETQAFLQCVYSFQLTLLLTPFLAERMNRSSVQGSLQHWVGIRISQVSTMDVFEQRHNLR